MLTYARFYLTHGLRRLSDIVKPRVFDINNFMFPRDSIHHCFPVNGLYPDKEQFPLKTFVNNILVSHETSLVTNLGRPQFHNNKATMELTNFQKNHKEFKRYTLKDESEVKDTFLHVINYGLLNDIYTYPHDKLQKYNQWYNNRSSLWSTINSLKLQDKHHFIFYDVPKVLPSLNIINTYLNTTNSKLLEFFPSETELDILELFRWLHNDSKHDTPLDILDMDYYHKVSLVFRYEDHYSVINLGLLGESLSKKDDKDDTVIGFGGLSDDNIKRRQIFSESGINIREKRDGKTLSRMLLSFLYRNQITEHADDISDDLGVYEGELPDGEDSNIDLIIDQDLQTIHEVSTKKKSKTITTIDLDIESKLNNYTFTVPKDQLDANVALTEAIDALAEQGTLTAADYRSLNREASKVAKLSDPFGTDKSILEASVVTKEDIKLPDGGGKIPDNITVFDKGMLNASMQDFDRHYVDNILPKDITSMFLNLQRAGIIVQDVQVDKQPSIIGGYEVHTLKVKPIDGDSSIIRYKLPIINNDGSYTTNSNTYKLRKQKAD